MLGGQHQQLIAAITALLLLLSSVLAAPAPESTLTRRHLFSQAKHQEHSYVQSMSFRSSRHLALRQLFLGGSKASSHAAVDTLDSPGITPSQQVSTSLTPATQQPSNLLQQSTASTEDNSSSLSAVSTPPSTQQQQQQLEAPISVSTNSAVSGPIASPQRELQQEGSPGNGSDPSPPTTPPNPPSTPLPPPATPPPPPSSPPHTPSPAPPPPPPAVPPPSKPVTPPEEPPSVPDPTPAPTSPEPPPPEPPSPNPLPPPVTPSPEVPPPTSPVVPPPSPSPPPPVPSRSPPVPSPVTPSPIPVTNRSSPSPRPRSPSPSPVVRNVTRNNTRPNSTVLTNATVPVDPADPRPGEFLPESLRQLLARDGEMAPGIITVSLILQGVTAAKYKSTHRFPIVNTAASLSGTPVKAWTLTTTPAEQQKVLKQQNRLVGPGRHLQQQPANNLAVSMQLMTTKPQLVWYRLAQTPSTAAAAAASGPAAPATEGAANAIAAASAGVSGSSSSCETVLCAQLQSAGVPVDTNSVQILPRFDALLEETPDGQGSAMMSVAAAPRGDEASAALQPGQLAGIIAGSVSGAAILLVLLLYLQKKQARSRSNSMSDTSNLIKSPMTIDESLCFEDPQMQQQQQQPPMMDNLEPSPTTAGEYFSGTSTARSPYDLPDIQQQPQQQHQDAPLLPPFPPYDSDKRAKFKAAAAAAALKPISPHGSMSSATNLTQWSSNPNSRSHSRSSSRAESPKGSFDDNDETSTVLQAIDLEAKSQIAVRTTGSNNSYTIVGVASSPAVGSPSHSSKNVTRSAAATAALPPRPPLSRSNSSSNNLKQTQSGANTPKSSYEQSQSGTNTPRSSYDDATENFADNASTASYVSASDGSRSEAETGDASKEPVGSYVQNAQPPAPQPPLQPAASEPPPRLETQQRQLPPKSPTRQQPLSPQQQPKSPLQQPLSPGQQPPSPGQRLSLRRQQQLSQPTSPRELDPLEQQVLANYFERMKQQMQMRGTYSTRRM